MPSELCLGGSSVTRERAPDRIANPRPQAQDTDRAPKGGAWRYLECLGPRLDGRVGSNPGQGSGAKERRVDSRRRALGRAPRTPLHDSGRRQTGTPAIVFIGFNSATDQTHHEGPLLGTQCRLARSSITAAIVEF